ncbi:Single-stranded DNA-binding protein [subsurface metagenome]
MPNFNRIILAGNLTRDPELRYTPSGTPVCSFDLAINSFYTDSKGEKKEDATFVPIIVWKRQAELCAEHLKKGRPALIEGRVKQERWNDKENKKRSRLTVIASLVRFLGTPPKAEDTPVPADTEPAQEVPEENIPF